jgi:hypothetical protein
VIRLERRDRRHADGDLSHCATGLWKCHNLYASGTFVTDSRYTSCISTDSVARNNTKVVPVICLDIGEVLADGLYGCHHADVVLRACNSILHGHCPEHFSRVPWYKYWDSSSAVNIRQMQRSYLETGWRCYYDRTCSRKIQFLLVRSQREHLLKKSHSFAEYRLHKLHVLSRHQNKTCLPMCRYVKYLRRSERDKYIHNEAKSTAEPREREHKAEKVGQGSKERSMLAHPQVMYRRTMMAMLWMPAVDHLDGRCGSLRRCWLLGTTML